MNPIALWRGLGLLGRVVAGTVAVVVVGLALWGVFRIVDAPRRAAEAKIESDRATAYTRGAEAAIATITENQSTTEAERERIEHELEKIDGLPPADQYNASIGLLCSLRSTSGDSRCVELRKARAGSVEGRGDERPAPLR